MYIKSICPNLNTISVYIFNSRFISNIYSTYNVKNLAVIILNCCCDIGFTHRYTIYNTFVINCYEFWIR